MTTSDLRPIPSAFDSPRIPWWLRSRHVQSVYPSFPLRRRGIERRARPLIASSRDWIIDCGEGVRLLSSYALHEDAAEHKGRQLVVLLHGWEGSADSLYVLALAQRLYAQGFDVVRLNLRDHGESHHLNRELFNSCRLPEVVGAVAAMQGRWPRKAINLVGFSLGGNFFLRVGAEAPSAGLDIRRIIAVSPVLDPERTLDMLESGHAIYRRYFIWKWVRSLRKKQAAWPGVYDFGDLLRDRSLTSMTDALVRGFTDYPDLPAYLRGYALVGDRLATLATRALIVAAADDPMIPPDDLNQLARTPGLRIVLAPHGGHCGFVTRADGATWITAAVERELARD